MKRKIVVLITGQKKRLELLSKINNIITPLSKQYNVTVVLSLSESNNFTNKNKYKNDFKFDSCNIKQELDTIPYLINDIVYPQLKINKNLVLQYDKQCKGESFRKQRAENHVRQYYTLYNSCSVINKINPDILIRIREDAILSTPLKLTELTKIISHPSTKCIITPKENSWGGINDKFAIVSKEAIEIYLTKPFEVYKSYNKNFNTKIRNPEQFYKNIYTNNGLSLLISDIKINIIGQ